MNNVINKQAPSKKNLIQKEDNKNKAASEK